MQKVCEQCNQNVADVQFRLSIQNAKDVKRQGKINLCYSCAETKNN